MTSERQITTVDDLTDILLENSDRLLELIDGEIVEKMPTQLHAMIVTFLILEIGLYLRQNPIGRIMPEIRCQLPDQNTNSRIPDLSFVSSDKGPVIEAGPTPYMPDLAIEVQSPGQSDHLMTEKAAYYLANGSRMVWLIYPRKQLVECLTAHDRLLLSGDDTLDGGDVLPGFAITVASIFAR